MVPLQLGQYELTTVVRWSRWSFNVEVSCSKACRCEEGYPDLLNNHAATSNQEHRT